MPNVMIDLPGMESTMSNVEIQRYLYNLAENLQYVLGNIDTENLSNTFKTSLKESERALVKYRDMTKEERADFNKKIKDLEQSIIDTATSIATEYDTKFEVGKEDILSSVSSMYVARTEEDDVGTVAELKEFCNSLVQQLSDSITETYTEITEMNSVRDDIENYKKEVSTMIRRDIDGIHISNTDSPIDLLLSNDRLVFKKNDVEVAWMQYDCMFITNLTVTDEISIGNSTDGYLSIITTATGCGFTWKDGES